MPERTSPDPFDLIIENQGFMLDQDQSGQYQYSQRKMPFGRNVVTAAAQPYAISDSNLEAPRGFFGFDHGMGFQEENYRADMDTFGYKYGLYIDSGDGYIVNGPAVNSFTPGTTGSGAQFFETVISGTRYLCALAGGYVLLRVSDASWTVANTFGGNTTPRRATVFRGTQNSDHVFISLLDTPGGVYGGESVWDGATTTTTFTTDFDDNTVGHATYHDYIIRARQATNNYVIEKNYTAGTNPTFGGITIVSDLFNPITDIVMFNERLMIITERSILAPYVEDMEAGWPVRIDEVVSGFGNQRVANSGAGAVAWFDYLFVPMSNGLFILDKENKLTEIGLGTLQNNTSEVQGVCTAMAGYKNWTMFACFYNAVEDASYLMRWGAWKLVETDAGTKRVFIPGWHGALYKFAGVQINAMMVSEVSGGPRLWLMDENGVIYWIVLPRYSMNWDSDSACQFNVTNDGIVYFPTIHHGVPHEPKSNLGAAIISENLNGSTNYITLAYRTSPADSFSSAALESTGQFTSSPGERLDFETAINGRMTELRATLTTTNANTPSIIKAVALYQAVRPNFKWIYKMNLKISDGPTDHFNHTARTATAQDLVATLQTVASSINPVTLINPYGESNSVLVTDIELGLKKKVPGGQHEYSVMLEMIQHQGLATAGSYQRLEGYTYGDLEVYTYAGLEVL